MIYPGCRSNLTDRDSLIFAVIGQAIKVIYFTEMR